MGSCSYCGDNIEHAFPCNHCGQRHCGEHRLPENHNCPLFVSDESSDILGGEGPDTRDRRSTKRKLVERVREKQTPKNEKKPPEASRLNEGKREQCSDCGDDVPKLYTCKFCSKNLCPECIQRHLNEERNSENSPTELSSAEYNTTVQNSDRDNVRGVRNSQSGRDDEIDRGSVDWSEEGKSADSKSWLDKLLPWR